MVAFFAATRQGLALIGPSTAAPSTSRAEDFGGLPRTTNFKPVVFRHFHTAANSTRSPAAGTAATKVNQKPNPKATHSAIKGPALISNFKKPRAWFRSPERGRGFAPFP